MEKNNNFFWIVCFVTVIGAIYWSVISMLQQPKTLFVVFLILNIWRVGGFQFKRKHKLNDGTMDVVLFSNSTFFILIFLFLRIIVKRYVKVERIEKITLKFKEKIKFNADGEESYFTDTLKINVIKEAICIYVDKKVKQKYF